MNTTERLAFRLTIAEPNTDERTITVCPRYDNLKLKWSRPTGQMYYTEDISGTLKFLGVDFQTLNACALNTQFTLIVYQNRVEVGRSLFRKTDCKWDIDHGVVDVDISVYDEYKKFQDKKDEEYNLVKILEDKKSLNLYTYPVKELWVRGSEDMIVCTERYAQSVTVSSINRESDIRRQFGAVVAPVVGTAVVLSGEGAGRYVGGKGFVYNSSRTGVSYSFYNEDESYRITALGSAHDGAGGTLSDYWWNTITLTRMSDMATVGTFTIGGGTAATEREGGYIKGSYNGLDAFNNNTADNPLTFSNGSTFIIRVRSVLSRLTSRAEISGWTAFNDENIREDEPMKYWKASQGVIVGSIRVGNSGPYSGKYPVEGGGYYLPPDDNDGWVAIWHESWLQGMSMWSKAGLNYNYPPVSPYYDAASSPTTSEIDLYKSEEQVNDFYLLTDAIRAVVQKMDEDIQFDSLDSQFLFNSLNPLNGIQQGALYISQKSNILNLGYDYPAWLAPVKWSQIETLLREAFDCYWSLYIRDGHKHLRIEHRKWYENGGNYTQSGVQVATIDLTSTFRNSTPFTFGEKTRHWEFDTDGNGTVSTASRHEYGWMDTQSEIFDGQPITVPEAYRLFTDEKTEQHKVDWFSSDIDFLTSVQAECSSDGFALVMENPNHPNWIITGAAEYSGQNYQLSFDYLQKKYLLQGIYAEYIKIGDDATLTATGSNARMRTSEIQLRVPAGMSIEASDTIKTQVGIGVIDTLEYDLHSELYTTKLRYENE